MRTNIPHTISYTMNKHAYIKIKDGNLHLSIPKFALGKKRLEQQLIEKGKKLLKKQQKQEMNKTLLPHRSHAPQTLRGKPFSHKKNNLTPRSTSAQQFFGTVLFDYATPRIEQYAQQLGIPVKDVRVKYVRSKWGSCTADNRIMLNLHLVHLPKNLTDYIIAHECAHLQEKNHTKKFRSLVERLYPGYQTARKQLRSYIIRK